MTDREAMKMALEALEGIHVGNMTPMAEQSWNKAINALRQALAQPEPIQVRPAEFAATVSVGVGADFVGTPMMWAEWPIRSEEVKHD